MKKNYLTPVFFLSFCVAHAQNNSDNPLSNRQIISPATGELLYIYQYEDVKGSAFLFDKWLQGTVILNNHAIYKNVKLKFDVSNNEFVFNRNDSSFILGPEAIEVRLFQNKDDSFVFKKGYDISNSIQPSKYLQVMTEGKLTFLKFLEKSVEEYKEYGDATKYKRFAEINNYYLYKDGKADGIRISKKALQSLLSDKWDKVSQYLSQNNLSGKDEKSVIAAIRYYNSL